MQRDIENYRSKLVGIDIITEDLTSDLGKSGGVVIEVNTPPGHFLPSFEKRRRLFGC